MCCSKRMSSRRLLSTSATSARRPEPPAYTGTSMGGGCQQNSGSAKQLLGLGQLPQRGSSRLTSPNSSHRKLHMNGVHTNDLEEDGQNYYPYSARGEGSAKKSSFNFGHANGHNYEHERTKEGGVSEYQPSRPSLKPLPEEEEKGPLYATFLGKA